MKDKDFKPLNIQFVIDKKSDADVLRAVADKLGDKRGDRRIRGAAVAREIVLRVLQSGQAERILELDDDTPSVPVSVDKSKKK